LDRLRLLWIRWRPFAIRVLPVLVFALCSWPAVQSYFSADDFAMIQVRQRVLKGESLSGFVFSPNEAGSWRPALTLIFYASEAVAPGNPRPLHAMSLVVQIASMLLLFEIGRRLTGSDIAAALAPLFWAVNMCVPETLAWSTGSMQVLLAFCVLLALYAFIRYGEEQRPGFLVFSWAAFLSGFLVLESNLAFPLLAAGWALVYCRRAIRATLPMAIVSGLFVALHQWLVPKHTSGPYSMDLDPVSLATTAWQYTRWFFSPENVDAFARTPHSFNIAWSVLAMTALLAFAVWSAWKRDFRAALFALFFLALIAPLTPLREHLSMYYLVPPGIGLGLLGAWGVSEGLKSRLPFRALTVLLLSGWVAIMPLGTYRTSKWWHDYGRQMRDFVTGLKSAASIAGDRMTVVSGFSDTVFWGCIHYGCAEAAGVTNWNISPEWTPSEPGAPGLPVDKSHILDDPGLGSRLRLGRLALFTIRGASAEDRTEAARERVLADRFAPPPVVNAGDPADKDFLAGQWYGIENGFRWMSRYATVLLPGPTEGKTIVLKGYCADVPGFPENIEIGLTANGVPLPVQQLNRCKGGFELDIPLPQSVPSFARVRLDVALSQTFRVQGDNRAFGLIFGTFAVR
jgi:hypothetical protein